MGRQEGGVLGGGGRSREKGAGAEGKGVSTLILGKRGRLLGRDWGGSPRGKEKLMREGKFSLAERGRS